MLVCLCHFRDTVPDLTRKIDSYLKSCEIDGYLAFPLFARIDRPSPFFPPKLLYQNVSFARAMNLATIRSIPKFLFNFSLIKKNALPFSSHSIIVFRVTTHQNLKEKLVEGSRALKRLIVYYDLVANFFLIKKEEAAAATFSQEKEEENSEIKSREKRGCKSESFNAPSKTEHSISVLPFLKRDRCASSISSSKHGFASRAALMRPSLR